MVYRWLPARGEEPCGQLDIDLLREAVVIGWEQRRFVGHHTMAEVQDVTLCGAEGDVLPQHHRCLSDLEGLDRTLAHLFRRV